MNFLDLELWKKYDCVEEEVIRYFEFIRENRHDQKENRTYEGHHIIPKSVDESFAYHPDNIAYLKARDHFLAHDMLRRCFTSVKRRSMCFAYLQMCTSVRKARYDVTPENYENARIEYSEACSGRNGPMYGKHHTTESKDKISAKVKGRKMSKESIEKAIATKRVRGTLGHKHTPESKAKISESRKEYVPTEETRRKISEGNKGRKASEETRIKLSESHKGRPATKGFTGRRHTEETKHKMSDSMKGENNPNYGRHLSDSTKALIAEASHNRVWKEESIEKLRQRMLGENNPMYGKPGPMTGVKMSEESREIMSESMKDRVHINNGEINKNPKRKDLQEYLDNGWKLGWIVKNDN